ncbi:UbiX family flavin prenyltransferase [Wolbachia endosymbiont of Chironomus riparius]|uniref:UbiX family flavin prenyltransferase n=1 Tax=Wolbachia endosymbiont of Chironomus riparius TaxID=2883238 RepID=UPI00209EAC49|nr:UbiX family flavin prenyltransferase [Wolbachia endosymbiont of Chironomus riparius]
MNSGRIIIGISGASGSIYGLRILEVLKDTNYETHLVISSAGKVTLAHEISKELENVTSLANFYYSEKNIGAKIASGTFKTLGMIISPCSMKTMSEIASGVTSSLLTRAADVVLKERRKLVLMVRESPLHRGHLYNMIKLTEMGAIIAPPIPAFYSRPSSLDDIINHSVGKVLDLFDIKLDNFQEWGGI